MDHTNDKVIIEPGFVYQVMEKYPEASLEINTAWLTLIQELTLRLVEIQTQYI